MKNIYNVEKQHLKSVSSASQQHSAYGASKLNKEITVSTTEPYFKEISKPGVKRIIMVNEAGCSVKGKTRKSRRFRLSRPEYEEDVLAIAPMTVGNFILSVYKTTNITHDIKDMLTIELAQITGLSLTNLSNKEESKPIETTADLQLTKDEEINVTIKFLAVASLPFNKVINNLNLFKSVIKFDKGLSNAYTKLMSTFYSEYNQEMRYITDLASITDFRFRTHRMLFVKSESEFVSLDTDGKETYLNALSVNDMIQKANKANKANNATTTKSQKAYSEYGVKKVIENELDNLVLFDVSKPLNPSLSKSPATVDVCIGDEVPYSKGEHKSEYTTLILCVASELNADVVYSIPNKIYLLLSRDDRQNESQWFETYENKKRANRGLMVAYLEGDEAKVEGLSPLMIDKIVEELNLDFSVKA